MQEGEEDCARSGSRREREGDRKTKRGRAREGETERQPTRENEACSTQFPDAQAMLLLKLLPINYV